MRFIAIAGTFLLLLSVAQSGRTQSPTRDAAGADWPMYRRDYAGTGYSPLTTLDTKNVANLTQSWTYKLQGEAPPANGRGGGAGLAS
jgi:glucose dehydrogenase